MKGNIWLIAVVAIAFVVLLPAVNVGLSNNADVANTTESVTVQTSGSTALSPGQDALSFSSPTLTVNGTEYEQGTDYTFDTENGSVGWLNSTQTQADAGESGTIAYTYSYTDQTTTGIAGVLGSVGGFLGLFFAAVCFGAILVWTFGAEGF